jgi:hypothetical protein
MDYLRNGKWSETTRDERTFCSYLFHEIDNTESFLAEIGDLEIPQFPKGNELITRLEEKEKLTLSKTDFEVGFEVVFYRDILHQLGCKVGTYIETLANLYSLKGWELENIETVPNNYNLKKRTFDLCLFSKNKITIIEAKAYGGLEKEQTEDFISDLHIVKQLYKAITGEDISVDLIVIASSIFFQSKSFKSNDNIGEPIGIGNRLLKAANETNEFNLKFVSWKQLGELSNNNKEIYALADSIYQLDPGQKPKRPGCKCKEVNHEKELDCRVHNLVN